MMTIGSETRLSVCSEDDREEAEVEEREEGAGVAPDGGWGWAVVLAGFTVHFLLDGINYTFGILLGPIAQDLGSDEATVVWAGSLLVGVNMLSGPLVGGLVNRFGCRPVAVAGSVLAAAAMAASTLARDVVTFILVYGVLGGLGFGLVFLPAVVCVGLYFERRRALATGVAVCGAGVGAIVFAPVAASLVARLGWRATNLVFSGLCLLNILCGLVMRPLGAAPREAGDGAGEERGKKLSVKILDPLPTIGENEVLAEEEEEDDQNNNHPAPAPAQLPILRNMSLQLLGGAERRGSVQLRAVTSAAAIAGPRARVDVFYSGSVRHIADTETTEIRSCRGSSVSLARGSLVFPRNSIIYDSYSANLSGHADKESCGNINEMREEPDNSFVQALKAMLNVSLLTDPRFLLIALSNLLGFLGFFVPFLYLPSMAATVPGVSADEAALLLSVVGLSNTGGRILCGYISDFSWADSLVVTNVSYFLTGGCILLFPLLGSLAQLVGLSLVYGLAISALVTLTSVLLVDVLGLDQLTSAFGLLIMFRGLATILGPPIAGAVYRCAVLRSICKYNRYTYTYSILSD